MTRTALTPADHHGLPALHTQTQAGSATLYLHGGTLTHVQPAGQPQPLLYLSPDAVLTGTKPLRGGVPVCFPWFGGNQTDPDAPAHGLVRNKPWELVEAFTDDRPENAHDPFFDATLRTHTDHFNVTYRVSAFNPLPPGKVASEASRSGRAPEDTSPSLCLTFTATNTTDAPRPFELALHTYFAVSDVRQVHVTGLGGATCIDQLANNQRTAQDDTPIRFTGEFDRIFLNTPPDTTLHDPGWDRTIRITTDGAPSAVVWNPWIEKSKRLADLPDDAWPNFLCIESGLIADDAATLAPGDIHTASVRIAVTSNS